MSPPALPPTLPGTIGPGTAPSAAGTGESGPVRLSATVMATTRGGHVVDTNRGPLVLLGTPTLRPGAGLTLELPAGGEAATGRLLAAGKERFDPPLTVRLRAGTLEPPTVVHSPRGIDARVQPLGADGRPSGPAFTTRLEPSPVPRSTAATTSPAPTAATTAGASQMPPPASTSGGPTAVPGTGTVAPAGGTSLAPPPLGSQAPNAGQPPLLPSTSSSATGSAPSPIGPGVTVATVVARQDAAGRLVLRAPGLSLRVETPLELPPGARLVVALPTTGEAANATAPPLVDSAEATARTLAEALAADPSIEPGVPSTPQLPRPDATLAARLLRLMQLIGTSLPADEPEPMAQRQPEGPGAQIRAAFAELGRVAGDSHGGWRLLLLPLGFEGSPVLRLHLRDEPGTQGRGQGRGGDAEASPRRAVFELELSHLGRCQIDALCQPSRFDLIVRTERPLAPDLAANVRVLFVAARDAAGLGGEVGFRTGDWVTLPEPAAAAPHGRDPITV